MKIKVLAGSIKLDDTVYGVGETLEVSDLEAKNFFREGIAEEVKEGSSVEEPKKEEAKVETKEPEVAPEVQVSPEPTLDWTRKELVAYAIGLEIENPDDLGAKEKILEAIQAKRGEAK